MTRSLKRFLLLLAGWFFLLLGIVGLFLPVLQGILFIVIGLTLLSSEYVWSRKLLAALHAKFPKISRAAKLAMIKVNRWFRRCFKMRR